MSMSDIQKHLTEPPIPIGGYAEKTMSDEEIGRIIKEQADMCMSILNGGENGMIVENGKCALCGKELTKGLFLCGNCKKAENNNENPEDNRRYAFRKKY